MVKSNSRKIIRPGGMKDTAFLNKQKGIPLKNKLLDNAEYVFGRHICFNVIHGKVFAFSIASQKTGLLHLPQMQCSKVLILKIHDLNSKVIYMITCNLLSKWWIS